MLGLKAHGWGEMRMKAEVPSKSTGRIISVTCPGNYKEAGTVLSGPAQVLQP